MTWDLRKLAIGFMASLLSACGSDSDAIGSYVASDDNTALQIQIASVTDGEVKGSISYVGAKADGTNSAVTRPFTGTIDGEAVTLSIENGYTVSLATGSIADEQLTLTMYSNGDSTQIEFTKADANQFNKLANAKRVRAAELKQQGEIAAANKAKVEQREKHQKSINREADSLFSKANEVVEKSRKLKLVVAAYHSSTDQSEKLRLAKANLDTDNPQQAYQVSAIEYELDGLSQDRELVHSEVQAYARELRRFLSESNFTFGQLQAECRADPLLDCSRLSQSMGMLEDRSKSFLREAVQEKSIHEAK